MARKPQSEEDVLAQIDASLAEDILTDAHSDADVAAALRAAGGDPSAIGDRGSSLVVELLTTRRLAWQTAARKKIERAQPVFARRADYSGLGRTELFGLLHQAKNNPRLSGPVGQLFLKRKPETISDDALRELLLEVDALALLDEANDKDPGGK
jgi:hypothetical protein